MENTSAARPAMTDSKGAEILIGDTAEVVIWDASRGTAESMLHAEVTVTGFRRSRVEIEMPDPRRFRGGTVTRAVGPETLRVWTHMRENGDD
jgi:hypothetical protein